MELKSLKSFLTIARLGNITKASEELFISQPALTRQIQDLELELGTKLLERSRKGTSLTDAGKLLKDHARKIVEIEENLRSDFANLDENVIGEISIGCAQSRGMQFVARKCHELQKRFPRIRFHLHDADAIHVIDSIERGDLDFGILTNPSELNRFEFIEIPFKDQWGVLMRRDDPLAKFDSIKAEELWNRSLILSEQSFQNSELSHWFNRSEDQLNIVATYNLIFNASMMVEEGMGIAIAYDGIVRNDQLIFRPLNPNLDAKLFVIWKKHRESSKASSIFKNQLSVI